MWNSFSRETKRSILESRYQCCTKQKNRRRVAIRFEISVTREAHWIGRALKVTLREGSRWRALVKPEDSTAWGGQRQKYTKESLEIPKQKEFQKICQKDIPKRCYISQKICQKECQKICQKECQEMR